MNKLIVSRPNSWIGKIISLHIYIDNKKAKSISTGNTIEIDITKGDHIVQVKKYWYHSPIIAVKFEGSDSKKQVTTKWSIKSVLFPMMLISFYGFFSKVVVIDKFLFFFFFIIFVALFEYLIGRKYYLLLNE